MRIPVASISGVAARIVLLGTLVVCAPLFVCMPLWVDTTYHDLSARNILWGGTHYRDIFETNLPGMVWLHALIRPVIGWSSEAIRIVDLVVVGSSIVLLGCWLKRIGLPRSSRIWFCAAAVFFYINETEFVHCQRDCWMLLPTVVALHLRGRQLQYAPQSTAGAVFRRGLIEGVIWGCAVWIKPHSLVPALSVWLASVFRLLGSRRSALSDFCGLLTGGALAGGLGSAWLFATGAWPYMWDVLLNWNGEYYDWSMPEMDRRVRQVLGYFAPWSLLHVLAIPMALFALVRAKTWRVGQIEGQKPCRIDQALIAALYLGWLVEAVFLQKGFHYSQTPPLLLAIAVATSQRFNVGPILIGWCLIGAIINHYYKSSETLKGWLDGFSETAPHLVPIAIPRHKLINKEWRSVWWQCVTEGSSPWLKDHLSGYHHIHCEPTWVELEEVRRFLEQLQVKDGELACWDDSSHPLYLALKIRPAIRFMHVNTALDFRSKRPVIRQELIASGHKYAVSDLDFPQFLYGTDYDDSLSDQPLELPEDFPCFARNVYPWNQPIIFRAGRYSVHRVENPIDEIRLPFPSNFKKP